MSIGPVEVIVVHFPGSEFNGEVAPALADAVEKGDIRLLDLVFVAKTAEDEIEIIELEDIEDDDLGELAELVTGVVDLLSDEDLDLLSEGLEVGSSMLAIVFEHAWAARLSSAVRASKGQVIMSERIPAPVVQAALDAAREGA